MIITDPDRIDTDDWERFVADHPRGNIFHTPGYFRFARGAYSSGAIVACCMEDSRIRGILVAVIIRSLPWPLRRAGSRAIEWGGPLAEGDDQATMSVLLEALLRLVAHKALFVQVRNLSDMTVLRETFTGRGFAFDDHLNILIGLREGAEAVWKGFHPARRKQVNRSIRRGVTVVEADAGNAKVMDTCYALLKIVYRRERLPCPQRDFFTQAAGTLCRDGRLRLFTALHQGEIIAFRMVLCYRDVVYDWYAASSYEHLDKYPNDILPWVVMKTTAEEGYGIFDFGGAGRPGEPYGVRDYKSRFGGELVCYGRFTHAGCPLLYRLFMTAYRFRQGPGA